MTGPFKMKGSSGLGYGNQHSKGMKFNAKLRAADLPEGKFKDAVDASGVPYASPAKGVKEVVKGAKQAANTVKEGITKLPGQIYDGVKELGKRVLSGK